MRWLYHIALAAEPLVFPLGPRAGEDFVHCSYRDAVVDSARLYFPAGARLVVLRLDPRRLGAPLVVATTPRGPMPHVHGAVPEAAVVEVLDVEAMGEAPDLIA